ncbi:hypothetical protein RP20_CCG003725, partial [Aedes albopictus]
PLINLMIHFPTDVMDFIFTLSRKYGTMFRVWVGTRLALFCTNTPDTETVLSSQKLIRKSELYKFLVPWLGNGLLLSTDQKWFNKRKIITPAFHFKILEQFIEVFDRQSGILVEKLKPEATGKLVNVYPFVTLCALDVICETAMGTPINAQTDVDSKYVRAVTELSYLLTTRFVKVWQRSDFLFNLSPDRKRQDKVIKVLHEFTTNIIRKRRKELMDHGDSGIEIQEEVDTFMFEGHDTTTIAIAFTLLLLARNPEVQEKVYKEVIDIIGTDLSTPVTYRNLQDMKYLEMIIKESLRLYPPVPIIGRKFNEKTTIGGNVIPEDSNFNLGIIVMHRDPKLFEDPEKFDPERQKFAMLELKSTLSKVIRHYRLTQAGPEPQLIIQLTLKPKDGLQIAFVPRA